MNQTLVTTSRSRLVLLALGVLVVCTVLAALFIPIKGMSFFNRALAHMELNGLVIADRTYSNSTIQSFGLFGARSVKVAGVNGVVNDYAHSGNVRVVAVTNDAGMQELWILGKEPKKVRESAGPIAALAVAPGGTHVAYVTRTANATNFANALSGWDIHLYDTDTGTDAILGQGFLPQFFTSGGSVWLLYTGSSSMTVTNLKTLQGFSTPIELPDRLEYAARISPQGDQMAIRAAASREYGLYEVSSVAVNMPLVLKPLDGDLRGLADVVFRGGNIYGIDFANDGVVSVMRVTTDPDTEDAEIHTITTSSNQRLIP